MNKNGFIYNILIAPLIIIMWLACWIFLFGPMLKTMGQSMVSTHHMTGLEGFLWNTAYFWVGLIPLMLYIAYIGFFGGSE